MRRLGLVLAALLLALAATMLVQHTRYLNARRNFVQDRQPMLYGSDTFHVLFLLRVVEGEDVIEALRAFKRDAEPIERALWVYAGKVAANALSSSQLGEVDWSAAVVVQYPSRAAYERAAASEAVRNGRARFAESYAHGFERPVLVNLAIHQLFLARRIGQVLSRAPSHFPFTPAERHDFTLEGALPESLLAERELGAQAAVVVNLTRRGTPEQQARDHGYTWTMMGAMAEGGYGPMHGGRAAAVEGAPVFDSVAIVYYPSIEFFAEMVKSSFFQDIIGRKSLGDAQASITVPVLSQL